MAASSANAAPTVTVAATPASPLDALRAADWGEHKPDYVKRVKGDAGSFLEALPRRWGRCRAAYQVVATCSSCSSVRVRP